jgi:hypothetical protein
MLRTNKTYAYMVPDTYLHKIKTMPKKVGHVAAEKKIAISFQD